MCESGYPRLYLFRWVMLVTPDYSSRILRGMSRVVIRGWAFFRGESISYPLRYQSSSVVNDSGCGSWLCRGAVLFLKGVAGSLVRPAAQRWWSGVLVLNHYLDGQRRARLPARLS